MSRLWATEGDRTIQGHGAVDRHGIISAICSERAATLKGDVRTVRDRLRTPGGELGAIGDGY